MSLGQRLVALMAIALLAGLGAVVLLPGNSEESAASVPPSAVAPGDGWYRAIAASRGPSGDAERTTCGLVLTGKSAGVAHAVLPCGAKVLIQYGDTTVLTEVIDNRIKQSRRQFELTPALARQMGLDGAQQIRWRFAAADPS
jgi:hypothetical protein